MIKVKRVYDECSEDDGVRILVDRLWPRGIGKDELKIDLWLRDIAPSNELRRWFGHRLKRWSEFKRRYHAELEEKKGLIKYIKELEKEKKTITLLYSAKDPIRNNAIALKEYLEKHDIPQP